MAPDVYQVTSPLMGTFYRASAPGEKPLVTVGQQVQPSEVVGIIESMKIFTELRAEKGGVVKKILAQDEDPVMKNQAVIEIQID